MPKDPLTALEKLLKLEAKKKDLIARRHSDILAVIDAAGGLTIDDRLLAGFLLFAGNPENKDHPILEQFKKLAKAAKIPKNKQ